MTAYYNEIDPQAAQWLRNLIDEGLIAPGDVDERSIEDVRPSDLRGYTQHHFFAGIGVWSYALRQAGWPDEKPVWTGSCPCQPFSTAGEREGFLDERHLWPAFYHLISVFRPPVVFGEQVASKAAEPWLDLVQADLEAVDYALGGVPFPSAGVGAPHVRDRLFWVADTDNSGSQGWLFRRTDTKREIQHGYSGCGGSIGGVADTDSEFHHRGGIVRETGRAEHPDSGSIGGVADTDRQHSRRDPGTGVDPESGNQGRPICDGVSSSSPDAIPCPTNSFWGDVDWLLCRDGKWRPVEPGTLPLAHGAPGRVVRLRAYGNAINAEAAREFIEAYLDARE